MFSLLPPALPSPSGVVGARSPPRAGIRNGATAVSSRTGSTIAERPDAPFQPGRAARGASRGGTRLRSGDGGPADDDMVEMPSPRSLLFPVREPASRCARRCSRRIMGRLDDDAARVVAAAAALGAEIEGVVVVDDAVRDAASRRCCDGSSAWLVIVGGSGSGRAAWRVGGSGMSSSSSSIGEMSWFGLWEEKEQRAKALAVEQHGRVFVIANTQEKGNEDTSFGLTRGALLGSMSHPGVA